MIISPTTFNLYGRLFNDDLENSFSLIFLNAQLSNNPIDIFYGIEPPPLYKYSLINNEKVFNSLLEDLPFPDGVIVPFPAGTTWSIQNEVIANGTMGKNLFAAGLIYSNRTMDIYLYSMQMYFGSASFDLFGTRYVFDGDYIYDYNTSERIAMAFGYLYIGCDNNAAYFYSKWDKSVYQFNGARNLTKLLNFSNRAMIKTGLYDGFSGELVFLTEDEILKVREGIIMNFDYVPLEKIIPTKKGAYVGLADGSYILLSPKDGDIDKFEAVTEYLGEDGSTVCDYERIDIRLYSPDRKQLSFSSEMQTINQDTKQSEQKRITIAGNDWSVDGYKTVKLIPQYKKGTGLSLRIATDELINIVGVELTYEPVARTANSRRSGY
jgi:hypothetical protein